MGTVFRIILAQIVVLGEKKQPLPSKGNHCGKFLEKGRPTRYKYFNFLYILLRDSLDIQGCKFINKYFLSVWCTKVKVNIPMYNMDQLHSFSVK